MVKLTPPMGWNSWNTFGENINEKLIMETAELFKEQTQNLMDSLGGENDDVTELHCAHIEDLDLKHFSMGAFGVDAKDESRTSEDQETYRVQTSRLYGIAEHFIKAVKGTLANEA